MLIELNMSVAAQKLIKTFAVPVKTPDGEFQMHCVVSYYNNESLEGYCLWGHLLKIDKEETQMGYSYLAYGANPFFVFNEDNPADIMIGVKRTKGENTIFEITDKLNPVKKVLYRIENFPSGPVVSMCPWALKLDPVSAELVKNQEMVLNEVGENPMVLSLLLNLLSVADAWEAEESV